jgi:hypothetical protein
MALGRMMRTQIIEMFFRWFPIVASLLWLLLIAPKIEQWLELPIDRRSSPLGSRYERLTKSQFLLTFGVLDLGCTFFIWSFGEDWVIALLASNRHFDLLFDLIFNLAFSVVIGVAVGLLSASWQLSRSPFTKSDLNEKR